MVLTRRLTGADDRGAVAILVAVFSIVVFVFAALIVDLGFARSVRRDAQNAADASALAAANVLYPGGPTPDFAAAISSAKTYASANFGTTEGDWSACSTTEALAYQPAGTSCISFDSATAPRNVRVVLPPRAVGSFFGGVVGYGGADVGAVAQAQVTRDSRPICAFCVLGPTTHTVQNGHITMTDGDIWVNGSLDLGPQGGVTANNGTVHVDESVDRPNQVSDPKVIGDVTVEDPLSGMPVPPSDIGTLPVTPKLDPCTGGPGFYGAVSLTGNRECRLTAGLYVFTEPLAISGRADLLANPADGVTLYFACGVAGVRTSCASDPSPGRLDAGGTGRFVVTAPTAGPRKGLAIVYDRGNTSLLSMRGDVSGGSVTGTVYAPDATLDMRGNGCGTTFRSLVVVKDLNFAGNPSCFTSTYGLADNVDVPPGNAGLVL